MSGHPLMQPDLFAACAKAVMETTPVRDCQSWAKSHWALALDKLQGTSIALCFDHDLVALGDIVTLDSLFQPLPKTDPEVQRLSMALQTLLQLDPGVHSLFRRFITAVVLVDRCSSSQAYLDSSVDLDSATHGLWQPGKGCFVGSSTLHLGVLWIEAGLSQSDLICGLVHEFVHFALNLIDMTSEIFKKDAYTGMLQCPSPIDEQSPMRPFALSLHAVMVHSVLAHAGLRMSTEKHVFDYRRFAPALDACADLGLTPQGCALLDAVHKFEIGALEPGSVKLTVDQSCIGRYLARHAKPTLLFWGGGDGGIKRVWGLRFSISAIGAVSVDGCRLLRRINEYSGDISHPDVCHDFKEVVVVDDPFSIAFGDIHRQIQKGMSTRGVLGMGCWMPGEAEDSELPMLGSGDSEVVELPNGCVLRESCEGSVADVLCIKQVLVTLRAMPSTSAADSMTVNLACFSVGGEMLASLTLKEPASLAFGALRKELLSAIGRMDAVVRFLLPDGTALDKAHESIPIARLLDLEVPAVLSEEAPTEKAKTTEDVPKEVFEAGAPTDAKPIEEAPKEGAKPSSRISMGSSLPKHWVGTHPVQISLAHQGGNVVRATFSEGMQDDQLLKSIARQLVETGSAKASLVKALQKFHYIKCNCPGCSLTGTLMGELCQECIQQPKIKLSDFADFGAQTDGYVDITFKKGAYTKAVKKLGTDEWMIRVLNTSPGKDDKDSMLPATFSSKFVVVTLLACEPGDDDNLVLSFATPGVLFHLTVKLGVLVHDVMEEIRKAQDFGEDVAVRLVTTDGTVLEASDALGASGKHSRGTKEVSDLIPRLQMRAVLGGACGEPGEDRLRESFEKWDVDGNGAISAAELSQIFAQLAPGLDTVSLFKILAHADLNKDGVLDYDEFVSWLLK